MRSAILPCLAALALALAASPASADPATLGQWSSVFPFEVVAIHAHLLPTGKVLYWDRHDYGDGTPRLWDPETGTITPVPEPGMGHDVFCSGHSFLKDGRLLVTGGHISDAVGQAFVATYDPFSNTWTHQPGMNAGRWYPTNTTLANGDVLTVSGTVDTMTVNTLPQVFQAASHTWRDLSGAVRALPFYPFMYLAPNGKVFTAGPQQVTGYLDTSGTGAWTDVANSAYGFREYGSSVLYDDGKILITGGSPPGSPTTATAEVIDLGSASPAWTPAQPMAYARRQHNATLLPDGTVLVTGGTSATGFNNSTGAVLAAELWDPDTGAWRTLASMQVPRLYHSVALLLPDGRVLSAGGGHPRDIEHGDPDHPDAEIYSPPYLFKGPRPSIASAPPAVPYGEPFFVGIPDAAAISEVVLIRLSSVTHSFNQEQRIVRPVFTAAEDGLVVTAPSDPNLCPPGYYLLFLLDGNGVPSVARILRVDPDLVAAELDFHTLSPCRLLDTRLVDGPLGGPALEPFATRAFALAGACGIPATARALSVNLTVTGTIAAGYLTVFPGGRPAPDTSSIDFSPDQTRANNGLIALSSDGSGAVEVQSSSPAPLHFILDVNGYFE